MPSAGLLAVAAARRQGLREDAGVTLVLGAALALCFPCQFRSSQRVEADALLTAVGGL